MTWFDGILQHYCGRVGVEGKANRRLLVDECRRFGIREAHAAGGEPLDSAQLAWKFMVGGGGAAWFSGTSHPWDRVENRDAVLHCVRVLMEFYVEGGPLHHGRDPDTISYGTWLSFMTPVTVVSLETEDPEGVASTGLFAFEPDEDPHAACRRMLDDQASHLERLWMAYDEAMEMNREYIHLYSTLIGLYSSAPSLLWCSCTPNAGGYPY